MPRRSRISEKERDKIVFPVCELFLAPRKDGQPQPLGRVKVEEIAEIIRQQHSVVLNREDVYALLRYGVTRRLVRLCPPANIDLRDMVVAKYSLDPARVHVVDVSGRGTLDYLAAEAADLAAARIADIARRKGSVHLALGSGQTTRAVALELANILRARADIESLTVHALTAGFAVDREDTTPVALFNFFRDVAPTVSFVGLYAAPMVPLPDYQKQLELPEVKKAFDEAHKIDVLITSLASAEDEHGRFTQLSSMRGEEGLQELRDAHWVGDIQYRPFSPDGPLHPKSGDRPVSLFEIPDLVSMAKREDKHVILVSGPCGLCSRRKTAALEPLLLTPSLKAWNWLVLDIKTARELITGRPKRHVPSDSQ